MDGRDTSKRERRGLWRGAGLTTFYMVLVIALLSLLLAEKMGVALPPGLKTLCEVLCVVLVLWEIFSFLPNPFREESRESPRYPRWVWAVWWLLFGIGVLLAACVIFW